MLRIISELNFQPQVFIIFNTLRLNNVFSGKSQLEEHAIKKNGIFRKVPIQILACPTHEQNKLISKINY